MQFFPVAPAHDRELVAGNGLARSQSSQVDRKVSVTGGASRFGVQISEIETSAVRLSTGMLADEAIQPALDAAGQLKVLRVNGEEQTVLQQSAVKPVG